MINNLNALIEIGKIKKFFSLIIISALSLSVQAQCENGISLTKVESSGPELNKGLIEVQVKSKGNFIAELYQVSGKGKNMIQKISGTGNQKLIFKDLESGDNYQVLVIFNEEEGLLCKKRQISEISTTKK